MSGIDLAWLRMERKTNPMMVVGVFTFSGRVKYAALLSVLQERLLRFERFRQMPAHDALGTHWEADRQFDIESHLHRLVLPARAGQAQLEAAASELASTPLDTRRPLWQFHLIERYRKGSALIGRLHHCYADGVALVRVMLSLTDTEPKPPPHHASADGAPPSDSNGLAGILSSVPFVGSAVALAQNTSQGALDLISASLHTLAHPQQAAAMARQVAQVGNELAGIAMLSEDPQTPLKGPLSAHKQVAWCEPLPLTEVKAIGEALGCTINDVLLASAAGALGSHLRQRGCQTDGLVIRALVPVNLRAPADDAQLGNRFGMVFVNLPVGERNPLARIYAVHQDMERLKHSSQAVMALWLLTAMGSLPSAIEERSIELFTSKASVVISNVPGPRQPLYLAGARIAEQFFWVPQAGSIGLGLSLLTYDGRVHFGLIADRNLVAEPRDITRRFAGEFEKLVLCVIA